MDTLGCFWEMGVDQAGEFGLSNCPLVSQEQFGVVEQSNRWNSLHLVFFDRLRTRIDFHFYDFQTITVFGSDRVNGWRYQPTWTAPRRPKIHQYGGWRLQNFGFKCGILNCNDAAHFNSELTFPSSPHPQLLVGWG
jgi:hypothetical protein